MQVIAFASDHAGVNLKSFLKEKAIGFGFKVVDLGTDVSDVSVDYPDFAAKLVSILNNGEAGIGVLICGTGIGISIAANRDPNIRAALCHNEFTAQMAREHNDANVLVLGAKIVDETMAEKCLEIFLNTKFEGGRHQNRVNKLGKKI